MSVVESSLCHGNCSGLLLNCFVCSMPLAHAALPGKDADTDPLGLGLELSNGPRLLRPSGGHCARARCTGVAVAGSKGRSCLSLFAMLLPIVPAVVWGALRRRMYLWQTINSYCHFRIRIYVPIPFRHRCQCPPAHESAQPRRRTATSRGDSFTTRLAHHHAVSPYRYQRHPPGTLLQAAVAPKVGGQAYYPSHRTEYLIPRSLFPFSRSHSRLFPFLPSSSSFSPSSSLLALLSPLQQQFADAEQLLLSCSPVLLPMDPV